MWAGLCLCGCGLSPFDVVFGAPMLAPFLDATLVAFRTACLADVAAVEQQPVVGTGDEFIRKMFGQFFFDGKWGSGLFVHKT